MSKLTKEQKKLLAWMDAGNTFCVCSDYGPKQGDITPEVGMPVRLFSKTIQKLYQAGLVRFTSSYFYGQRWDEFNLTRKGREIVCSIV